MKRILIIKVGALGDVLRTTSVLPGLVRRYQSCQITWVTAADSFELVDGHRCVHKAIALDPDDAGQVERLGRELAAKEFDLVLSFDDEEPLCRLAAMVGPDELCGAYLDVDGGRAYTDDAEPWFGMGLIARDGVAAADRRKLANQDTHAEIFAAMLGVEKSRPELPLDDARLQRAAERLGRQGRPLIGLNTGAGGRWRTKALSVERSVELADQLATEFGPDCGLVLFGGEEEAERNRQILAGYQALGRSVALIDAGVDNDLLDFAALVSHCDLMVTSDSLGMHVAIARAVPVVAFFAPTSAAEIDLFGAGEKVLSESPDYCSYKPDADNSTITPAKLVAAARRVIG